MIATGSDRSWSRFQRLGTSLLLLLLPACGLSDYETLMRETQMREQRFRDEKKYLDEPVQAPMQKDKDGKETPLANVFFRPPKGIGAKPDAEPLDNLLWRYRARSNGGEFAHVEMAFATDDKDFVTKVYNNYQKAEEPKTPQRDPPLPFDSWEFDGAQNGYSINISKGTRTQVAIVFVFGRGRRDVLRKVIDLSLESFAVDQQANAARQMYGRKSPWQLQAPRAP